VWHVELLTIFPEIFDNFLKTSLIGKAVERGLFNPVVTDIRQFAASPHFKTDDYPYGGGAGMVMMAEPLVRAVEAARERSPSARVILLNPCGKRFDQPSAQRLSQEESLIIICGRYEGIDQRVIDLVVDEEISIGDFVTMGGEVPAMTIIEACLRLRPDVIQNDESTLHESFSPNFGGGQLVEAPQYTRPQNFRGLEVPAVLTSGNHQQVADWRLVEAQRRTKALRDKSS